MMKKFNFFILFLFFIEITFASNVSSVKAFVSKSVIYIGEVIHYEIEVTIPQSWLVEFPEITDNLAGFAIKDFSPAKERIENGHKIIRRFYKINTFETGDYVIPPAIIKCGETDLKQQLISGGLYVRVDSRLSGDEKDIADLQPAIVLKKKKNWLIWLYWGLGILGLISFLSIIIFWVRRKEMDTQIILSPWDQAIKDLENLVSKEYLDRERFKEYFSELSDILRFYIEGRFAIMAPERTTEEFILLMQDSLVFTSKQKEILKVFLKECDLIKFAGAKPEVVQAQNAFERVKEFVQATKEDDEKYELLKDEQK